MRRITTLSTMRSQSQNAKAIATRGTRALSLSGAARQWLYAQVNLAELAGAACE